MTYNGRTNRETRLVNVHFNPETINDIEYIKSMLEDEVESIDNSFLQDFINLGKIDWDELKESLENEEE